MIWYGKNTKYTWWRKDIGFDILEENKKERPLWILSHPTSRQPLKIKFAEKTMSSILFLGGSYLRNCHQVLWSLGILIGQQKFYGTELVKHPLNVLPELGYITCFILNC